MSKHFVIIILGFLIAILPYLGFPQKFKSLLFVFSGLVVALLAYLIGKTNQKNEKISDSQHDLNNGNTIINNATDQNINQNSLLNQ